MAELTFYHVRVPQYGFGRMGLDLRAQMMKEGVTVYHEIADSPDSGARDDPSIYLPWGPRPTAGLTNVVLWASVTPHVRGWWKDQVAVLYTMFEANHLPESLTRGLEDFDTVIIPSRQNQEMFSQYHPNVHYVPLGIDPDQWFFVERTPPTDRFNFLTCGKGFRKGTDLAYEAFVKCFPDGSWGSGPVPHLIIQTPDPDRVVEGRIETINGYLEPAAERELFSLAHCLLAPARGEGFGLRPLQAIAQGCPTILTDAHGHESFAFLGVPISAPKMTKAADFLYGDGGYWWEPNFDELCDAMLWVYNNYAEALRDAKSASVFARSSFTWRDSAVGVLDAIGLERLTPYKGEKVWHPLPQPLYRVVLKGDHSSDSAGYLSRYQRGVEYMLPADIKRQFFDLGKLDVFASTSPIFADENEDTLPTWDGEAEGLLPAQMAQLPEMWAARDRCAACGQLYGAERAWERATAASV